MNRSELRKIGFQGRRDMVLDKDGEIAVDKKGRSTGRRIGSFLGRKPNISNAPAVAGRRITRRALIVQGYNVRRPGRSQRKRTTARIRATQEEGLS